MLEAYPLTISMKQTTSGFLSPVKYEILFSSSGQISWTISKSFHEFLQLKLSLEENNLLPRDALAFPPKLLIHTAANLESRRLGLQRWLVDISTHRSVSDSPWFRSFIGIDLREESLAREAGMLGQIGDQQVINAALQHEPMDPLLAIKDTSSHLPALLSRESNEIKERLEESKQLLLTSLKVGSFADSKLRQETAIEQNKNVLELKKQYEELLKKKQDLEVQIDNAVHLDFESLRKLHDDAISSQNTSNKIFKETQEAFESANSDLRALEQQIVSSSLNEAHRCLAEATAASARVRLSLVSLLKENSALAAKQAELSVRTLEEIEAKKQCALAQDVLASASRKREAIQLEVRALQEVIAIDNQATAISSFEKDAFSHRVNESMELNKVAADALKEAAVSGNMLESISTSEGLSKQINKAMQEVDTVASAM
jgi:PX domain